jgi:hypothetical protein
MYGFYQQYGAIATSAELEQQQAILHHPPRSFESFVAEITPTWNKPVSVASVECVSGA